MKNKVKPLESTDTIEEGRLVINAIMEHVAFLEAVLGKYQFPNGQLDSLFEDWKKKQGIFRD